MSDSKYKFKIVSVVDLDGTPWTRQELVSGWRQEVLEKARVTVFGAGAMGNEIVKNLVLLGVGDIKVVDFDIVDVSNLSRSIFFRRSDAEKKRLKVDAIVERAKDADPYGYVKIRGYNLDIESIDYTHEVFKDSDIILAAVDSLEVRLHINIQAYYLKKPLIDGGMESGMGYVQVVIPPYTSCLACSMLARDRKILMERLSCRGLPTDLVTPKTPAIITTTSVVAAIMVHELIKILHGLESFKKTGKWDPRIGAPFAGKRLFINLTHGIFQLIDVPVSSKCPLYELHKGNREVL